MSEHNLIFSIFLIFAGAAVLSTLALWTRQSLLVVYMVLGIVLGPWGLKLINDTSLLRSVSDVGIIFLLFLLGLNLPPQKLFHMLRKVTSVALISSIVFAAVGYVIAAWSGFSTLECAVIGAAMMFSSTIIGIKLLPTTVLHHQHTGQVMISVLLMQDLLAILVLLILKGVSGSRNALFDSFGPLLGFPIVLLLTYILNRFLLIPLLSRYNRIKEYLFLLAIAWCLSITELAQVLGLSSEIGAFLAGVSLASNPISLYIAESLKPVRDFFLVLFFFSIGAAFNLNFLPAVILPAVILTAVLLILKPMSYRLLLSRVGESKSVAFEVGVRLAQISEFSLIIAYTGLDYHLISNQAAYLIEAVTILSFVVSSYWVVLKYPTPIALSDRLRRD